MCGKVFFHVYRRHDADERKLLRLKIMKNELEALTNPNGETYYKGICPFTGEVIYSFSADFEDFWSQDDEDLYS